MVFDQPPYLVLRWNRRLKSSLSFSISSNAFIWHISLSTINQILDLVVVFFIFGIAMTENTDDRTQWINYDKNGSPMIGKNCEVDGVCSLIFSIQMFLSLITVGLANWDGSVWEPTFYKLSVLFDSIRRLYGTVSTIQWARDFCSILNLISYMNNNIPISPGNGDSKTCCTTTHCREPYINSYCKNTYKNNGFVDLAILIHPGRFIA